ELWGNDIGASSRLQPGLTLKNSDAFSVRRQ
ncbi:unnamed protein product, partial [marine sediment metagenome]